jgi:hypothetical protein
MDLAKRSKCANCRQPFRADARNAWHQRYCNEPACRAASKVASQRRWLAKPENRDYFRGPEHVVRVRAWREAHAGYGARAASASVAGVMPSESQRVGIEGATLQDLVTAQVVDLPAKSDLPVVPKAPLAAALQDLLTQQPIVLIGLLAHLSDSTLQDDIALAGRRLLQLGHDVLGGASA